MSLAATYSLPPWLKTWTPQKLFPPSSMKWPTSELLVRRDLQHPEAARVVREVGEVVSASATSRPRARRGRRSPPRSPDPCASGIANVSSSLRACPARCERGGRSPSRRRTTSSVTCRRVCPTRDTGDELGRPRQARCVVVRRLMSKSPKPALRSTENVGNAAVDAHAEQPAAVRALAVDDDRRRRSRLRPRRSRASR